MKTNSDKTIHDNTIIKRIISVTSQDGNTIKKKIETLFSSGKFIEEELVITSIRKIFHS